MTKTVSVVTAEDIERQHVDTALEALRRNVPGLFIRQTGAIGRTTASIIRGSTDDQVLVLIDGVEANSPTLGGYNFATLPADQIESIEVLRGSASTLYGSKAIGGVINIRTKRGGGAMRTAIESEFGSLYTFKETLSNQAAIGPVRYHAGITRLDTRGLSEHDDVELTHGAVGGTVELTPWLSLDAALNAEHSWVGLDDGARRPDPNRFTERDELVFSTAVIATPVEGWQQELRFGHYNDELVDIDVADPGTAQTTAKSRFNATRYSLDWLHRVDAKALGRSTIGLEFRDDEAESTVFNKTVVTWGGFWHHQIPFLEDDRLIAVVGVRYQRHNVFGNETTAETSTSYRIPVTETRLRAGFSQGFRAPDLNDLYFPNFGNPALQPERSETYETAVAQDLWNGRLGVELIGFHTEVDQLIQAVRISATSSQARNIAEAEMEGFELEGHIDPMPGLRLAAAWAYTDAEEEPSKEELPRVPKHTLGLSADYRFLDRWTLALHANLIDNQEENTGTNSRNRTKGYARVNGSLTVQATKWLRLYGRIENLFDRQYSEVLGFSAPGTLFFIGGRVEV